MSQSYEFNVKIAANRYILVLYVLYYFVSFYLFLIEALASYTVDLHVFTHLRALNCVIFFLETEYQEMTRHIVISHYFFVCSSLLSDLCS